MKPIDIASGFFWGMLGLMALVSVIAEWVVYLPIWAYKKLSR